LGFFLLSSNHTFAQEKEKETGTPKGDVNNRNRQKSSQDMSKHSKKSRAPIQGGNHTNDTPGTTGGAKKKDLHGGKIQKSK